MKLPTTLALLTALLLAACDHAPPSDRASHLLSMAAEEAAAIPNTLDRFSRQLNIADTQLNTNRLTDADKTLQLARDTLASANKQDFDDFHRIAGWTAIAQLAQPAQDRGLATVAADLALAALNDVKPEAQRPQYVLSLAAVLSQLNGKPAAVELLNSGSGWAANILDAPTRRSFLIAFTSALLDNDAYENARTALRHDPDPAWRTDTFLALANQPPAIPGSFTLADTNSYAATPTLGGRRGGGGGGRGAGGAAASAQLASESAQSRALPSAQLNKDVRFESVFKQSH